MSERGHLEAPGRSSLSDSRDLDLVPDGESDHGGPRYFTSIGSGVVASLSIAIVWQCELARKPMRCPAVVVSLHAQRDDKTLSDRVAHKWLLTDAQWRLVVVLAS